MSGIPVIIEVLNDDGTAAKTIELTGTDLPEPPLEFGGRQRIKKTVYPTGTTNRPRVTMQILGAEDDDLTLQGVWKDKRGGDGHAAEMTELLDRIRYEGKPVRVSYDTMSVEGIVTEFKPSIRTRHDVHWSLTVSIGDSAFAKVKASQPVDRTADVEAGIKAAIAELHQVDDLITAGEELWSIGGMLAAFVDVVTAISAAVGAAIEALQEVIAVVQQVVNLASATLAIINKARTAILRAALQLARIRDQVADLFNSTWQALTTNPLAVLEGTSFAREVSRIERLIRVRLLAAKAQLDAIAEPAPQRVHAVGNDDTLFSIARVYYRDPLAWRRIAEANGLRGADLGGRATLVIP